MEAVIVLIGTLVPTMAATAFYVGDRRAARHHRRD